ncbi:MAG: murein biosynthesis integral membrane protein MurJ [Candidatus Puniceispirillales bacterium]
MEKLKRYFRGPGLLAAMSQIGGLTALSRVLGFCRDILIAIFIGAGPLADAFFIAFKLPNLFRRLTAEGAMTNAFMPAYARAKKTGEAAAAALAADVQVTLLWALVVITLVLEMTMPVVITMLAPGFDQEGERYGQAITLARITMPFLPMISLVAFWAAITNAHNRFLGGAAAPVILNLALIGGALGCGILGSSGAVPLAVSVPLAGVIQLVFMRHMLGRINKVPAFLWWPRLLEQSRRMWRNFFSAAIGAGAMQINLLVDTILASTLPAGAIAGLYYADRIAQLPLGIIGIALGTALLPRLSHLEADNHHEGVRRVLARGFQTGLFFGLPAATASILLAEPIIAGLFAYGAFAPSRIEPVSWILMAYGAGIPAFILAKIIQPAFFAANDPKTPLRVAMLTIAVNIGLSLTLMQVLGAAGIALATSLSSWLSVVIMVVLLFRRNRLDGRIAETFGRVLISTFVMGAVLAVAMALMAQAGGVLGYAFVRLVLLVIAGLLTYLGLSRLLKAWPKDETLEDAPPASGA